MTFKLSEKSLNRLAGLKSELRDVVEKAIQITEIDFSVIEGIRSKEKQVQYVKDGFSKTLDSYHITGHAVDIYPWRNGKTDHSDDAYVLLSEAMFKAAEELGIDIEWGGNWKTFVDKPHWQINRVKYK